MFGHMDLFNMEIIDSQTVELYFKPIKDEYAKYILDSLSGNKLYITRISELETELNIVKKSTALFSYFTDEDISTNEGEELISNDDPPSRTFLNINPDFQDDKSNIEQSGNNYIATQNGLFIIYDNKPKIIPISLDGSCDVKVSEDSMSVNVDIYPSVGNNPITTFADIVTKIRKIGVASDIKESLLVDKLKDVEENKKKFRNLCIAEGKPAINGIDGRLENCTGKKEKIKNFVFSEFHRVNPVISVKEGQIIAFIHPPTVGEYGSDIFGRCLDPKPGKIFVLRLGANTCFSEENENQILAQKDGFLNLSDTSISITDTFTVKGDIDFESGNIVSKGSLKVNGNVKNEFTLSLTKNVEIRGYVGDATVEAGEKITIHGGFLGKGKGILMAKGDIKVKFVENQKVYSRGSLHLVKDTLNAKLFIKNKILSSGSRSAIIGGQTIAGESIEIYSLGNDTCTETIVEVGFDYLQRNLVMDNKKKQQILRNKLEYVDKYIFEYAKMKRLSISNAEKVKLLAYEHKNIVAEIEKIKEENMKINDEIYIPTQSKITVKGMIYPGVKIGINGRFLNIYEPMKAKTFVLSKDDKVIAL